MRARYSVACDLVIRPDWHLSGSKCHNLYTFYALLVFPLVQSNTMNL